MVDKAQDGYYTVAVLFYEDAVELLRHMMLFDDITIASIEIKPETYDGYNKEYYVSLAEDMVLSVEPAYSNGQYLRAEADLTLIDGDASSSIIKDIPEKKRREIYIGVSEDEIEGYDYESKYQEDCDETICYAIDANSLIKGIFDTSIFLLAGVADI